MLKEERKLRVTAKDIARQVGLSQPTVSRILSDAPGYRVSSQTRERVLSVAQEMGYRPNALARSLRSQRTHVVGLYTGYGYVDARNAFLAGMIGGLQRAADAYQMDLLLHGTFRANSTEALYSAMVDGRIDGLFVHTYAEDPLVERLRESGLPTVAIADTIPGIPSVVCDNAGGMRQLVDYLWGKGHRRIGFIRPGRWFTSVEVRRAAFEAVVREYGAEGNHCPVLTIELEDAEPVLEWLAAMTDPPTALCCWNDLTALRLLEACRRRGVRVPEDLAVCGFDGLIEPWISGRSLFTVGAPWDEITAEAMRLLIQWIERGISEGIPELVCLPVQRIAGDTA
jgi:DNA-binding LacI/PurR family transcriptional regulator